MATFSPNIGLTEPNNGDEGWGTTLNSDLSLIDAQNAIGYLGTRTTEVPSASLNIRISAGTFIVQNGTPTAYAGTASQAMTASNTNSVYLDNSATLHVSTTGFPASPNLYCPIAVVVAGSSTITSIADARVMLPVCGPANLPLAGGTMADGANIAIGTTTGTQIGTASTQKLGLFGVTPVVLPAGAAQGLITDSSGGTVSFTLATVGATNSSDVSATINNNISSVNSQLAAIRTALVALGAIKGSA